MRLELDPKLAILARTDIHRISLFAGSSWVQQEAMIENLHSLFCTR